MNKCKKCKFYKPYKEENFYSKEYYNRKRNFGECTCKKFQYSECKKKKKTDDMLLYCDSECYSASFEVGKNFGCIHFKEMKTNDSK